MRTATRHLSQMAKYSKGLSWAEFLGNQRFFSPLLGNPRPSRQKNVEMPLTVSCPGVSAATEDGTTLREEKAEIGQHRGIQSNLTARSWGFWFRYIWATALVTASWPSL